MKLSKSLVVFSFLVLSSGIVSADVPTKPSYLNSIKEKSKNNANSNQELIANDDLTEKEHSRARLEEKKEQDKSNNVLKSVKSGRLSESHKHIED